MFKLRSSNVTALCVTNRPQFVPNILRQWQHTEAGNLVVVVDYAEESKKVLSLFENSEIRTLGRINYRPKTSTVEDTPIIEWDNVKLVVAIGRTTIGACRNLALRFTDTNYVTWIDDDDLQRPGRVPALITYARNRHGIDDKTHIIVKGGVPLIDAATGQVKTRPRSLSWREGIYFKPELKPFPALNLGEDYHWMFQFGEESSSLVKVAYPGHLAVDIKHASNISDVRKISTDPRYWEGGLDRLESQWQHAFKVWQKDLEHGSFLARLRTLKVNYSE